ncbi:hypothetical protein [Gilliamella sp. wkB308]|uniref:hypothetical protein n=1 Tax=Gilliamella sp. wkB308 TaxID=3120263 RepID=UPI00080D9D3A|nr:hypothetical protein [Gilliamella apicola]OCF96127.1 hypothetical protein A9G10_11725 [Gilliamella apicola]
MVIIITDGIVSIESNIVNSMNNQKIKDVLNVDNLTDETKFANLLDLNRADFMDKDDFITAIVADQQLDINAIFHHNVCSSTIIKGH